MSRYTPVAHSRLYCSEHMALCSIQSLCALRQRATQSQTHEGNKAEVVCVLLCWHVEGQR